MYFTLGLLTAGLLGLMVAPAVWRRAVRLTRARIERSVPLTLSEIQADKDQLRAEFAMSTRRLEMSVERLKEKAAEQLIEINRKREMISRLTSEHTGRADTLKRLEEHEGELRERLRAKEEALANTTAELSNLEVRLTERNNTLMELEKRLDSLNQVSAEQTVELVARNTEIDNLRHEVAAERANFKHEISDLNERLTDERRKVQVLEARIVRVEAEREEAKGNFDRRDKEVAQLTTELSAAQAAHAALESRLADAEAARVEADAAVARLTLAMESESRSAIGDNMQATLAALQDEKDVLAARIVELQEQREQLVAENAELRRIAGEDWETERRENALLRERLNDLAAKVSQLTRTVAPEADNDAPVETAPQRLPRKRIAVPADMNGEIEVAESGDAGKTLAERVRGLQRPRSAG
jgi:DNA repair exonuclease SbcCD ATPase subunit